MTLHFLDHYVFCLKCKQHCQTKLANLDGNAIEDIFPLMYNYLQFSYYKGQSKTSLPKTRAFSHLFYCYDSYNKMRLRLSSMFEIFYISLWPLHSLPLKLVPIFHIPNPIFIVESFFMRSHRN